MTDLISRADALAACQKIADYNIPRFCIGANTCRDAIATLPAAQVRVKPLEWVNDQAQDMFGDYYEVKVDNAFFEIDHPRLFNQYHRFASADDAKNAAQSDHETRIRAALIGGEA